ncbi:helix-turn-helix transcriptional regulator [Paracoccus sp. (in: a-proteobacteria)]|uniref:helix-turn-helix transcriptional regulator n=1 Tax=Paracoccus sp. TaxID=267 RepID=UPI002AFEA7CC|nr:helix-turn-helix transcriptional regulator [Paracoccus sp. (in: a-proteobacteria)]
MESDKKQMLARTGDMGLEACAIRVKAARLSIGFTQLQMAEALGLSRSTNISNVEKGSQYPNREMMSWMFREHRIDFNFLMAGFYAQLPGDVQQRLFPALEVAGSEWEKIQGSGRSRSKQPRAPQET